MKLVKKWGAADFDEALWKAASEGRIECMKLLKSWGARKFEYPLVIAERGKQVKLITLLKTWINEPSNKLVLNNSRVI